MDATAVAGAHLLEDVLSIIIVTVTGVPAAIVVVTVVLTVAVVITVEMAVTVAACIVVEAVIVDVGQEDSASTDAADWALAMATAAFALASWAFASAVERTLAMALLADRSSVTILC